MTIVPDKRYILKVCTACSSHYLDDPDDNGYQSGRCVWCYAKLLELKSKRK